MGASRTCGGRPVAFSLHHGVLECCQQLAAPCAKSNMGTGTVGAADGDAPEGYEAPPPPPLNGFKPQSGSDGCDESP